MLSGLQSLLRELVVSLARGTDDYQFDLGVGEDSIDVAVDDDTLGRLLAKPRLQLSAGSLGVTLHDCMELEESRAGEDEGYMEGEASEANAENTSLDGCHGGNMGRWGRERIELWGRAGAG